MGLLLGPLIGGVAATQIPIPIVFVITGIMLLAVAALLKMPRFSFSKNRSAAKETSV